MREFRLETDPPEGEVNLNVTQFQPGDFVDVIGRSKGKGFQGVMKKHNFAGPGCSARFEDAPAQRRHRQSFHTRSHLEKYGHAGHMGDERVTVQNLQVMQVREEEKIILISGAVPGANGSYVVVRPAIKQSEDKARGARKRDERESFDRRQRRKRRKIASCIEEADAERRRCMKSSSRCARLGVPARQHQDESRRRFFRRQTVAAKRNGPRARRLQIFGDLAWWWRRLRAEAARLFKEDFEIVRRLAFQKALSERIKAGDVLTVDEFAVKEIKTKKFVELGQKTD